MTDNVGLGGKRLVDTGIEGLDDILGGGLTPSRLYLLEGDPGAGKTTLGLQFLLAGARRGERGLYIGLGESLEELQEVCLSHGWSLDGIEIVELAPSDENLAPDARYTMFHPAEVELNETIRRVIAEVERVRPARVVFDSLSELRLLAQNTLRYRRQVLALKQAFAQLRCTVLLVDDQTRDQLDLQLQSLAHGILSLERHAPEYGTLRRRLQVTKLRARAFREGHHDFKIRAGGLDVFPRLVAAEHHRTFATEPVKSELEPLDALLGGGLSRGTSTLIMGAAGAGKSSLATQFARAAAARGEHVAVFLFDELVATFMHRAAGLGMELATLEREGRLSLRQIDPAELAPGEFAHAVQRAVERANARLIVIDSLNGYLNAMPSERLLLVHLHELLSYLGQQGITTIMILAQHGTVVPGETPVDTSYLADTVMVVRFFEVAGEVRQAISVIKKRTGNHERTIRELRIASHGLVLGEPLLEFQGILSGRPKPVKNAR